LQSASDFWRDTAATANTLKWLAAFDLITEQINAEVMMKSDSELERDVKVLINRADIKSAGVLLFASELRVSYVIGIASRNVCIGILPKHQRP
jgi:hypothetical protein